MKVSGLWIYPVKGCGGIALDAVELDALGPRFDRRWMVVDPEGVFRTQRTHPTMALIRTALHPDRLVLSAPGMPPLELPLEAGDASVEVEIWGDRVVAGALSSRADDWVSRVLGAPSRLARLREESEEGTRVVDPTYSSTGRVGFADAYPVLLISEGSLEGLNRRMETPLPMDRFRPNVVVSGAPPHDEDRWRRIRLGGVGFRVVKACARCNVPLVDQETGVQGKEPLRTLARYRRWQGKVWFGQNLVHDSMGRIARGDPVEVLETGVPRPGPELAMTGS